MGDGLGEQGLASDPYYFSSIYGTSVTVSQALDKIPLISQQPFKGGLTSPIL